MAFEFQEEKFSAKSPTIFGAPKTPKMVDSLVKAGVAGSKEKAMKILLWSSIILLALSIVILLVFVFKVGRNDVPPGYSSTQPQ